MNADDIPMLTERVAPADIAAATPVARARPAANIDIAGIGDALIGRFQSEWPALIEAQCRAVLEARHPRLGQLTGQLAAGLTGALETRLMDWLRAALNDARASAREMPAD